MSGAALGWVTVVMLAALAAAVIAVAWLIRVVRRRHETPEDRYGRDVRAIRRAKAATLLGIWAVGDGGWDGGHGGHHGCAGGHGGCGGGHGGCGGGAGCGGGGCGGGGH